MKPSENKDVHCKITSKKDAMAKSREKKKALIAGTVVLTTLERAKKDLHLYNCNVGELLQTHRYDGMNDFELKKLHKSANDKLVNMQKKEKIKETVEQEEEKGLPHDDSSPIDGARLNQMVNTFFHEFNLDPSLTCLKRQNQLNNIAFYQFVLSLPKCPVPNFLQMLSEVIASEAGSDQKLRLFHSFCGLYDGKWTGIFEGLCIPAVEYLASTEQAVDKHAHGFLRYTFVNGIDLACGARAAAIFDLKFSHVWLQLGVSLWSNLQDSSMFSYLPQTIMTMRQPMINALKDSSLAAIPPDFFRVSFGILTYSCISEESLFRQLLYQFNDPLSKNYTKSETTSLLTLCLCLEKEMKAGNRQWFAQPLTVIKFIGSAHEMIKLGRVPGGKFTPDVCTMLLASDNASVNYLIRPAHKKHKMIDYDGFLKKLIALNSFCKETVSTLQSFKTQKIGIVLSLFKHLMLEPSPIQEACIRLVQLNTRLFLCPQAGTGKSTLMNALIIEGASQGKQVLVVNPFKELLFRDYAAVRELTKQMELDFNVQLLIDGTDIVGQICFLTFEQLPRTKLPLAYHLVIDEFQEELYSEKVFTLLPILRTAVSVTAFSGSLIRDEHTLFLQNVLPLSLVVQFPDIYPNTLTEEAAYICMNMQSQVAQISVEVEKHRVNAPVTVIASDAIATMYMNKISQKKKAGTILLFGEQCNAAKLDQLLTVQNFCESTNDGSHKVYFTLKKGGVGIDYPSTDAINKAGGNVVIVCVEPTTHSQLEQFRRRTARMGAPGIVTYVLQGNSGGTDPHYLKVLEGTLKENELQLLLELYYKFRGAEHKEVKRQQCQSLFKLVSNEEVQPMDSQSDGDMKDSDNCEVDAVDENEEGNQESQNVIEKQQMALGQGKFGAELAEKQHVGQIKPKTSTQIEADLDKCQVMSPVEVDIEMDVDDLKVCSSQTKHIIESNMVKIKVEGQSVYIKEGVWDAYMKETNLEDNAVIGIKTVPSHQNLGKRTVAAYENNFEEAATPTSELFSQAKADPNQTGKRAKMQIKVGNEEVAPSMANFLQTLPQSNGIEEVKHVAMKKREKKKEDGEVRKSQRNQRSSGEGTQ